MEFTSGELLTEILSLLPVKSLLRLQCLSKASFALINDPYFINKHFENSNNKERSFILETSSLVKSSPICRTQYDYYLVNFSNEDELMSEPVNIFPPFNRPQNLKHTSVIGSCNSLVCILYSDGLHCPHKDYEVVIWNPSIKKYRRLPFVPKHKRLAFENKPVQYDLAFGYDPVNNDYKVLMVVFTSIFHRVPVITKPLRIMVYSLKAHSWRRVEYPWPCKVYDSTFCSEPAFWNGAFHWLIRSEIREQMLLLAFDLTSEKFEVHTFPFKSDFFNMDLQVLGGSLSVFAYAEPQDINDDIAVWTMKEYEVASSWIRLYTVPMTFRHHQSLAFSKDGKKILMKMPHKLFWYHINKKTCRIVDQNDRHYLERCWTTSCVESLLLLDGDSHN